MRLRRACASVVIAMRDISQSRLPLNLAASLTGYAATLVIGFWFTPYLIRHLGVAGYGLVPLATMVTSYMSLLTLGLNGAAGRYLTISLERGDTIAANRVFNTSLFGSALFVLVATPIAILVAGHADVFFEIPAGYVSQFRWLFYCTIAVFMLTTLRSPFALATYCRNRFELSNGLSIIGNLVRVGLVVLLFSFLIPGVWQVGVGLVAATVVVAVGSVILWRVLTPSLQIDIRHFDVGTLRLMTSTSLWFVVNQVGTLLYLSIDLLVVNRIIGSEAGGQYAALLTWSALLRGLGGAIAGVFTPTMLAHYARGDFDALVHYGRRAIRLVGLTVGWPAGLISGFAAPFLSLWLGPEAAGLATLLLVMTIHLPLNLCVLPMFGIQIATNKVRTPGVVTCVMGLANLGLALFLAGPAGWGMMGVAVAGLIMLTAKNLLFTPMYAARCLHRPLTSFYRDIAPALISSLVLTGACRLIAQFVSIDGWAELALIAALVSVAYVSFMWLVVLTSDERKAVRGLLRGGANA